MKLVSIPMFSGMGFLDMQFKITQNLLFMIFVFLPPYIANLGLMLKRLFNNICSFR